MSIALCSLSTRYPNTERVFWVHENCIIMELEIKHLTPYLPYGLKIQHNGYTEFLEGIAGELCSIVGESHWNNISHVKPILRPMSDFDKPHHDESEFYSFMGELNSTMEKDFIIDRDLDFDIEKPMFVNCSQALKVYDFLFKNHFDVFGLIPAGLAIDINTINK